MGWVALAVLAALAGAALWRFGRLPRAGLELAGAALLIAVAGYAWQGSPGLGGRPTRPPADVGVGDSEFAKIRGSLPGGLGPERMGSDAQVLDTADAFHRQGLDSYSVGIIKGALDKRPNSADLWVGLGNALVLHNQGMMSPAAQLAFQRAAKIAPDHPGPPFFFGLALAQGGQTAQAAQIWRGLLAKAPADAPWRKDVEQRLAEVEAGGMTGGSAIAPGGSAAQAGGAATGTPR